MDQRARRIHALMVFRDSAAEADVAFGDALVRMGRIGAIGGEQNDPKDDLIGHNRPAWPRDLGVAIAARQPPWDFFVPIAPAQIGGDTL